MTCYLFSAIGLCDLDVLVVCACCQFYCVAFCIFGNYVNSFVGFVLVVVLLGSVM